MAERLQMICLANEIHAISTLIFPFFLYRNGGFGLEQCANCDRSQQNTCQTMLVMK